ncbi:alpha-L-fucosidase [Tamlana sp. 2201CG12-4]|uniref:alpha-L-fucosidase n=1 Tax=Tamlana sp. 2201CG12-4 TaxID=3112582 RepID=UPI002DBAF871|nr:alpha-L-fucosidase [Tamlana sp. 2201CG12-4]MEC3907879.1 alpha-L-fucosidase [Tamlana sp. 2201CG12-4]
MAYLCLLSITLSGCKNDIVPPEPFGPLPNTQQMQWHDTEFYAFIHFTINTFTDKEWGFGDESPKWFDPTAFNAEQIVLACKNAGMKGLVLTTKHHDGFCLWPTKTTEHNISKSPYKNGNGDIVGEIVKACRKHGLKVGMYLSPWDRNHKGYGSPEYIKVFREQLKELLSNYGEIFEVWFDGANGGTGYYGGANENRTIDRATYYDWDGTFKMIRALQPTAAIFSDIGLDVRWIGTEEGFSGDPCWHRYTPKGREEGQPPANGQTRYWEAINGHREGKFWMPAETNTSIRPGWFYHESEDSRVKSPETLVKLYYESLGHGTTLILNLPPDRRGLIHENDMASLTKFKEIIDATFAKDLSKEAIFKASNTRGNSKVYGVSNLRDDNQQTYWASDDKELTPEIVVEFPVQTEFNVVNIREFIPLGQRIWGWALDKWTGNEWEEFAKAESIGHRRLWKGSLQTTNKIRLRITKAVACPVITQLSVHLQPISLESPLISRDKSGYVTIAGSGEIHYTIDGTEPNPKSPIYRKPLELKQGGIVKSKIFYHHESSPTTTVIYNQTKKKWEVLYASSQEGHNVSWKVIDENNTTDWHTLEDDRDREIIVNLGEELDVEGFVMTPRQDGIKDGIVTHYEFYTSLDGKVWDLKGNGEFSNIYNNPIEQQVSIEPTKAKYIMFKAVEVVGKKYAALTELGVITK